MTLRPAAPIYKHRGHVLVTPPALEPVLLTGLRLHLRLDGTSEDAILALYLAAAREHIENVTGLAMFSQAWRLTLDEWPGIPDAWWGGVRERPVSQLRSGSAEVVLPRYPLLGVDSVTVYDQDRQSTAVTVADVFHVDVNRWPGRLVLRDGATWPIALASEAAIEIQYRAGFASVPSALQLAIMRMAAMLYTHRGDGCSEAEAYSASGAKAALEAYRVRNI